MNITDFLNARIAEDEAMARAAIDPSGMSSSKDGRWLFVEYPYEGSWPVNADAEQSMWADGEWETHAENWDPARVLAECAAKRAIVAEHAPVKDDGWVSGEPHGYLWCASCGSLDDSPVPYPCFTVGALAAVYAEHPEYLAEWKVGA